MSRPINFDRTEILDKLTHVFWQKGYNACTIDDLVIASGLNRSSLYNSFGNKESVFRHVLEHYKANYNEHRIIQLKNTSPVTKAFKEFFFSLIDSDKERLGCLQINTVIELSAGNKEIDKSLKSSFKSVLKIFYDVLKKAQEKNEIKQNTDIKLLASYLLNNVYGIRVATRAGSNKKQLKEMITIIIKNIV